VGNLSYDAAESDLFELFSGVGTVSNVEIVTNKHTQRSKGFGFVQMNAISEAKRAVDELHDKEYMGRKLVVSGAKLPSDRPIGRDREEVSAAAEPSESAPQQA
jgi:RNA recognition motif-containing protein